MAPETLTSPGRVRCQRPQARFSRRPWTPARTRRSSPRSCPTEKWLGRPTSERGAGRPVIAAERDGSVVVAGGTYEVDLPGAVTAAQASGTVAFLAANFFPAITVENAASYVANTVVPGELVSIQGYGMGLICGADLFAHVHAQRRAGVLRRYCRAHYLCAG